MRIDPNSLGNLGSVQTGRAGETEATNPSSKGGSSAKAGSAASDRVELSSFTGRLSQALAASSTGRAQRVAELKAAVHNGTYQPDPLKTAQSIVNYSLQVGNSQ